MNTRIKMRGSTICAGKEERESCAMAEDFLLFLDESGDHRLEWTDPDYPLFVLSCVIVRPIDYVGQVLPALGAIKVNHWGHEGIVLHSSEIRRQTGPFQILRNRETRDAFMGELGAALTRLPFRLAVAIIDKRRSPAGTATNPYALALHSCLRQARRIAPGMRLAKAIAESRGAKEDAALVAEGGDLPIIVAPKRANLAGLQLADLCAYPFGRHLMSPSRQSRAWDDMAGKIQAGTASCEIAQ